MRKLKQILFLSTGIAAASLLAVPEAARAQNAAQVIPVAPGINLVVTTFGGAPPPIVMQMPDPIALIQQTERNLEVAQASMLQQVGMLQQNLPRMAMPSIPQGTAAIVVTSFSDGHGICTQRTVYPANGGAPQVDVSATDGACKMIGVKATPTVSPLPPASTPAAPVRKPQLVLADAAG